MDHILQYLGQWMSKVCQHQRSFEFIFENANCLFLVKAVKKVLKTKMLIFSCSCNCSTPPENYKMHPLIFRALIIIIVKETSVLYCSMWPSAKIWEKIVFLTLSSFFWNGNIYKEKILKNASKCLHPLMQEIVSLQKLRRAFYKSEPIIWRKLGNRLLDWPASKKYLLLKSLQGYSIT